MSIFLSRFIKTKSKLVKYLKLLKISFLFSNANAFIKKNCRLFLLQLKVSLLFFFHQFKLEIITNKILSKMFFARLKLEAAFWLPYFRHDDHRIFFN